MLLLLLPSRFVEAGFLPSFIFGCLQLLRAEHAYRWPRPVVLLCLSGVRMAARRRAAGRVLCVFDFCAACGARAAAYQALFVQRRAAAKALFCKSY